MKNLRFIISPPQSAARNMAIDEALFVGAQNGSRDDITVHLYAWDMPSVSLGYAQRMRESVDVDQCRQKNIPVVRRITGGGVVLHGDELTFSVTSASNVAGLGAAQPEVAAVISRVVADALERVGITTTTRPDHEPHHRQGSCLMQVAAHDILAGGKKLSGTASRWKNGGFLYQGYIPLQLPLWGDSLIVARTAPSVRAVSTSVAASLGRDVSFDELSVALITAWSEIVGCAVEQRTLTDGEERAAKELEQQKYQTTEWTLLR